MSSENNVKGYAPLPQSISNTDTEDDEDEHHHQADSTSKEDDQSRTSDATVICQNGRFYPLDETKNPTSRVRNGRSSFGYSTDNIPTMVLNGQNNDDLWKRHDMTPLRRFFFVVSVLLCIVTILVFLWVLPCDTSSLCTPALEPRTPISWDQTFDGVELHGKISIIKEKPYNLIFLLRGQQFGNVVTNLAGKQQMTPKGGGILSLQGISGIPLWWIVLKKLPVNINCELFDTNGSGKPDCIVSGEDGLLVSIEPIAGTIIWNSESHTYEEIPLQLSDLDSDGINDLLSVSISNTSQDLIFLSGKTGKLLSRLPITGCHTIKLDYIDSSFLLTYSCYNLYLDQIKKTIMLKNFIDLHKFSQTRRQPFWNYFSQQTVSNKPYPNQTSLDSWDLTAHHRLYVRNAGGDLCPGANCFAKVNLTLRRGRNESRIWDHISDSSFVTRPAILDSSGRAFTTGFVLKFWNWTSDLKKTVSSNIIEGVRPRNLTERVSIVFVNNTIVRAMNASQSDVLQLCQGQNCQPCLPRHSRSILIADLNGDGVSELISYRSTYTVAENDTKPVLTSKVQVVKLDDLLDEQKLNWLFENAVL